MKTAEVLEADGVQSVKLPEEFHLTGKFVEVHRQGEAIMLVPVKRSAWPAEFLDRLWNSEAADASQEFQAAGRFPLD